MSSPRLEPWFIPDTIRSGRSPSSPRSAKRTQSTGVPSVAKPRPPSLNSTSLTESGERVVMLRAVALRLESGAITCTPKPSTAESARLAACRPWAPMPSSFVSRTFTPITTILGAALAPLGRPRMLRVVMGLGYGSGSLAEGRPKPGGRRAGGSLDRVRCGPILDQARQLLDRALDLGSAGGVEDLDLRPDLGKDLPGPVCGIDGRLVLGRSDDGSPPHRLAILDRHQLERR